MGDEGKALSAEAGGLIWAALSAAAQTLADVSDTPRLDAELLMAHALGVPREVMLLGRLDDSTPPAFAAMVARRLAQEPIAYITGRRAFWTIELAVGPGALIPRPDSETLIDAAIAHFAGRAPSAILDLGTGPGTLLLAALDHWRQAQGLGIDLSEAAVDYARRNAIALGLADRVAFRPGNWTEGVTARFDLILANPPYVGSDETLPPDVRDHEPPLALFGGRDGLDAYRALLPQLPARLAPDGLAVVEIGASQAAAVTALARAAGLGVRLHHDLAGRPRALALQVERDDSGR